ncbi:MAG: DUF86 domain-containing protein [Prevotellaceae bacterium]|jgi:uncharacterized protein with HEPN domain|nr:DUF86 domain-containing protein [Prevotellaceae bacterium]
MKEKDRTCKMFFDDLLLAIDRVFEYTENHDFVEFKKDYKTVDAVIRNFEIIGEAAKNIPSVIKEQHAEVPWSEMYLLRNKISHEYFGIDYEIIWDIITNYLPANRVQIEKIAAGITS